MRAIRKRSSTAIRRFQHNHHGQASVFLRFSVASRGGAFLCRRTSQRGRIAHAIPCIVKLELVMKELFKAGFILLAYALSSTEIAVAQPANSGCSSEYSSGMTQTLHCEVGITIVAENGARYNLQSGRNGRVDAVELSGKALLIEALPKSGGNKFQVITPQ